MTRINDFGTIFRFITPVLVTIAIFILGMVLDRQGKFEEKMDEFHKAQTIYFTNHLSDQSEFRVMIEHRLTKIEAKLQ